MVWFRDELWFLYIFCCDLLEKLIFTGALTQHVIHLNTSTIVSPIIWNLKYTLETSMFLWLFLFMFNVVLP